MTVVGVVSDTHGQFDPYLHDLFEGVEHILHGGDVGPESILDEFETIAPASAVRGNTDLSLSEARFPIYRYQEVGGFGFLLTHIIDDPTDPETELRRHLELRGPRVVIYGHTHQHRAIESEGVLFLNPGSAGPKRFRLRRTACLLHLGDEGPRPTFYDLELRTPIETDEDSR